jgi:hypothetical protein
MSNLDKQKKPLSEEVTDKNITSKTTISAMKAASKFGLKSLDLSPQKK